MNRNDFLKKLSHCNLSKIKELKVGNAISRHEGTLELNLNNVSEEYFLKISDSTSLKISNIDFEFMKLLTNLESLIISEQLLTQMDFEKICCLNTLKRIDLGDGKSDEYFSFHQHEITDFSSILNLSNLEYIKYSIFQQYFSQPVITNIVDFKKLLNTKFFKENPTKKVKYVGKEPLPLDLFDNIKDIELEILSPLVIEREFAEKYENSFPGKIEIIEDLYKNYNVSEIYCISQKMKEIIENIPEEASDFEKVAIVYKVIGQMCIYDITGDESQKGYTQERGEITRSLRGCYIENGLVCRGFSLVVKKLLDELGIECKIVSGSEKDSEDGHSWNQVKIDGKWYNLDITWDLRAIKSHEELSNFLLSDEEFYKEHDATDINIDIMDFISGNKFDFLKYRNRLEEGKQKPLECEESYDQEIIKKFFENIENDINYSKNIVSSLTHSSEVKVSEIEANMKIMTDNTKEINSEERNDKIY